MSPFQKIAKQEFGFLEREYPFFCTEQRDCFLKYESGHVTVAIIYDCKRSYEIGIEIKRPGLDLGPGYSLSEILRCWGVPESSQVSVIQVVEEKELKPVLSHLSGLTGKYCQALLHGDPQAFSMLRRCREKEMNEYARQRDVRQAREQAQQAWLAKDYKTYLKIMEPHVEDLDPSEVRKVDYARKQS